MRIPILAIIYDIVAICALIAFIMFLNDLKQSGFTQVSMCGFIEACQLQKGTIDIKENTVICRYKLK